MTDAEKLFNAIWNRWTRQQSYILSFRVAAEYGRDSARELVHKEKAKFVYELRNGQEYARILLNKEEFFKKNPPEQMIEFMTTETLRQAQIATDAASIVFAHSVVDGAAIDYCRVTALVAPKEWEAELDQKKISLADVREMGYDKALNKKLMEYLDQLERESLLEKADLLFARCKPPDKWTPMKDYAYDRERLAFLDNYRHRIVHEANLEEKIDAGSEVDYLMRTVLFFMGLVNLRYGIQLDPLYAMTGIDLPR